MSSDNRASVEHRPVDPWLVDAMLAVGIGLLVAVAIAADTDGAGRTRLPAYLFAAGFGALILLRRPAPRVMLILTIFGVFAYYTLDFTPIGVALPAVAALFAAAERGRVYSAVIAGVILVGTATFFQLIDQQQGVPVTAYDVLTNIALVAAAIALGVVVRQNRRSREQAARIRALTAAEQAAAVQRRVQQERVAIARDLHDVIGHNLSVVSLHAGVAGEAIGRDDTAARAALDQVRTAASDTLQELRATVKLLRDPAAEPAPAGTRGLSGVEDLARSARATGLRVEIRIDVPVQALDATIDTAAYRVVQEALTNTLRHAGATVVVIRANVVQDQLWLSIMDDGHGVTGKLIMGSGITGMSERAGLLGGTLRAGNRRDGGFEIDAELPVSLES